MKLPLTHPGNSPGDRTNHLLARVNELRASLRNTDPSTLADHTGTSYKPADRGKGEFHLQVWGREVTLPFPELNTRDSQTRKELAITIQALILYYFQTADGTPVANQWISFSELPDGRFYNQAFQGYTGKELVRVFQSGTAFEDAAQKLGGVRQSFGDAAFAFQVLPRVSLMVVFWRGDEDFPSSFQILFDASAGRYLPTDACAIAGSMLTRQLVASR